MLAICTGRALPLYVILEKEHHWAKVGAPKNHKNRNYPVVNGGSDKWSELGVFIFPIDSLFNGEPATELPTKMPNSVKAHWAPTSKLHCSKKLNGLRTGLNGVDAFLMRD